MRLVKSILYSCAVSFLLFSCSQKASMVPKSIEDKHISFNSIVASPGEVKNFLDKNVVYFFDANLRYQAVLDGQLIDVGDYSYQRIARTQSANLIFSYTIETDKIYVYEQRMDFNSSNSGTWYVTRTNDPEITKKDRGTFKILD